ncbi:MAG: hypothetical protein C4527_01610 [Candidatus Omnitrophota bacterium]|jgi:arylsulfatase A-like enzyme|nr:MAG: hypothetical protein C4527_01610 [Candidatus Omnitrophota bacterium]
MHTILSRRFLLALTAGGLLFPVIPFADGSRPNFVLITVDDLGYGDLGCYDCRDINTPKLDGLARQGVRLTDFYIPTPAGTHTRCALLTGRYPQRIPNLLRTDDADHPTVEFPTTEITLASILHHYDYKTGWMGKWDLSNRIESGPHRHGFDEFCGFLGDPIGKNGKPVLFQNNITIHSDEHLTDWITEQSIGFLDRNAKSNFMLCVAYHASHWPSQTPDGKEIQLPADDWSQAGDRKTYTCAVERIDRGIGGILQKLHQKGLKENTFVIFSGNNGGGPWSRNAPLSGQHTELRESGIRVPCILRWPKRLPERRTSTQTVMMMDVAAMILSAAEILQPRRLDGFDILPYLGGEREEIERTFVWRSDSGNQKALRWGKWKWLHDGGNDYLFNLEEDMAEEQNVKDRFFDILFLLKDIYGKWEQAMAF